jgi:hypothetical protein
VDPDSLNPDPDTDPDSAFHVNLDTDTDPDPIRIQGFDDQKLKKKNTDEKSFGSKIVIYLCPSYMRRHQPSKENIKHFKK